MASGEIIQIKCDTRDGTRTLECKHRSSIYCFYAPSRSESFFGKHEYLETTGLGESYGFRAIWKLAIWSWSVLKTWKPWELYSVLRGSWKKSSSSSNMGKSMNKNIAFFFTATKAKWNIGNSMKFIFIDICFLCINSSNLSDIWYIYIYILYTYQSQVAVISNHHWVPFYLFLLHKNSVANSRCDFWGDDGVLTVQVLVRPKSERALSPGNSATPEVGLLRNNEAKTLHMIRTYYVMSEFSVGVEVRKRGMYLFFGGSFLQDGFSVCLENDFVWSRREKGTLYIDRRQTTIFWCFQKHIMLLHSYRVAKMIRPPSQVIIMVAPPFFLGAFKTSWKNTTEVRGVPSFEAKSFRLKTQNTKRPRSVFVYMYIYTFFSSEQSRRQKSRWFIQSVESKWVSFPCSVTLMWLLFNSPWFLDEASSWWRLRFSHSGGQLSPCGSPPTSPQAPVKLVVSPPPPLHQPILGRRYVPQDFGQQSHMSQQLQVETKEPSVASAAIAPRPFITYPSRTFPASPSTSSLQVRISRFPDVFSVSQDVILRIFPYKHSLRQGKGRGGKTRHPSSRTSWLRSCYLLIWHVQLLSVSKFEASKLSGFQLTGISGFFRYFGV